jgi:hypothetical protein
MACFVLMLLYVVASEIFAHFQNGHVGSPILSPDGELAVHVEYAPETLLWLMHSVVKLEELPSERFTCMSELLDSRSLRWSDIRMTWTENNVLRLEYPDAVARTLYACGAIVHIVPDNSN